VDKGRSSVASCRAVKALPCTDPRGSSRSQPAWPLEPAARQGLIAFGDQVEGNIAKGKPLEAIRALANKLVEHATRLAAVLALSTRSDGRP
jgi:hypothetical protein